MKIFRKGFFGNIGNKGLRYKLILAFSLMSIIPLLACMYVVSIYAFPHLDSLINVSAAILFSIMIAMLGLVSAKGLIDPVINMALEAKIIAGGEYDRRIEVSGDDEVGNLAMSINSMTQKIKTNLDELKSYSQRMREINVEIHRKVLGLSSLLQIGDFISTGSLQLNALLDMAVEKMSLALDSGFAILYMPKEGDDDFTVKSSFNIKLEALNELKMKRSRRAIFERILEDRSVLVIDKGRKLSREEEGFMADHNFKNILAIPISSGKRNFGMLIVGNHLENYQFKNDDVDLIKVFAKQITIAIESDLLTKKTEELAIKDDLTGLYNKSFMLARLEEEIKRAIFYQRPCSFIVFNIDNFKKFRDSHGELAAEEALIRVARLIKDNAGPIGRAARIAGDEFAMLLPEKNKKEASRMAEEIRVKVESTGILKDGTANLTLSGGLSENPIDGATGDEIFKKAMDALRQAKSLGKNRVAA